MKKKFHDSAKRPIIALDFDGMLSIQNKFPRCGDPRKNAQIITHIFKALDIKVVIWTSRDCAFNQSDNMVYDHISPVVEWLHTHNIHFDAINKSVEFAPFLYNGRKIYAHMYVDDNGFGWEDLVIMHGEDMIMQIVAQRFLHIVCGVEANYAKNFVNNCIMNHSEYHDYHLADNFLNIKSIVDRWKED